MKKILISACLLGENCKYSGGNNLSPDLLRLLAGHTVIPVCPEVLGGLHIPRIPGRGVFAELALRDGFRVMDVEDVLKHGLR